MADLDTLLQDFSYLRSLQERNQTPRTLSTHLKLPHPTVVHSVRQVFEQTKECTFTRVFQRPLGYECMKAFFLSAEYAEACPLAAQIVRFNDAVRSLTVEEPAASLDCATKLIADYVDCEPIASVVTSEDRDVLSKKMAKLADKAQRQVDKERTSYVNTKDIFKQLLPSLRQKLAEQPWKDFCDSSHFVRYAQWKHLELNLKVSAEHFNVHRIIGRGGFGEVFPCQKRDTGHVFAMKRLDKRLLKMKHQEQSAMHERNVLAEMNSKFVTNLRYAFQDKLYLYLILDLMDGGDLQFHLKRLGKFSLSQMVFYTAEIIMGLAHIHSRGMIYRDLKPPNVLLDCKGHARISDLGLTRPTKRGLPTSECGTVGYMAPEVIEAEREYTFSADLFSLGCLCYELLTGHNPFRVIDGQKIPREETTLLVRSHEPAYPADMDPAAADFVQQLLRKNPDERLGSNDRTLSSVRKHALFADVNWSALAQHKVAPAIVPLRDQVNASTVHDIEQYDASLKRVVVSAEEQAKYYDRFDHVMSHHWQDEILGSVFGMCTAEADRVDDKRTKMRDKLTARNKAYIPEEAAMMQGYLKRSSKKLFQKWERVYCMVFQFKIVFCNAEFQLPSQEIEFTHVSAVDRLQSNKLVLSLDDGSEIKLKIESAQTRLQGRNVSRGSEDVTFDVSDEEDSADETLVQDDSFMNSSAF